MNFTEYVNQQNPEKMPKVILCREDIKVINKVNISAPKEFGAGTMNFTHLVNVSNPGKWSYNYLVRDNGELWTYDSDGNPKKQVCFYLEKGLT